MISIGSILTNNKTGIVVEVTKIGNDNTAFGTEFWYGKSLQKAYSNAWREATVNEIEKYKTNPIIEKITSKLSEPLDDEINPEFVEHLKKTGYTLRILWCKDYDDIIKNWFTKMGRSLPEGARPVLSEMYSISSSLKFVKPENVSIMPKLKLDKKGYFNNLALGIDLYINHGLDVSVTKYNKEL